MAQVDVGINFDLTSTSSFSVDGLDPSFFQFTENIYLNLDVTVNRSPQAFYIDVDNIFDYNNFVFNTDTGNVTGVECDIDFSFLNFNIKARSGACADISIIQEYTLRAYHTILNQYVFWRAGTLTIDQATTGYDPAYLTNIVITNII